MKANKMYIPKTIKVGYNERPDTYTKKLAYVTYMDDKGVHRKKNSWDSWRNHKLGCDDFDNEPTSGFVLNKGVGGVRHSYGRNARNEYIRIYDPRNFEFEISVENLLFILQECSSIKGKGLEGDFVYSWSGTQLVLLPVSSAEYQECVKHTERQKVKFDKSQIAEGCTYIMKDGTKVVYLGHLHYHNTTPWSKDNLCTISKKHVFANLEDGEFIAESGFKNIAERISSDPIPEYPDIFSKFKDSIYNGAIVSISFKKVSVSAIDDSNNYYNRYLIKENNKYYVAHIYKQRYYYSSSIYEIKKANKPLVIDETKPEKTSISQHIVNSTTLKVDKKFLEKLDIYELMVVTDNNKQLRIAS